ncbi:MAG TPA: right-handed parallel beta-helix repeat-containing protein [Kofleriaceae bacterium]|nr:right-handed parallel beta-helix repeat-containing protein [Kofleriaceae bacterium]
MRAAIAIAVAAAGLVGGCKQQLNPAYCAQYPNDPDCESVNPPPGDSVDAGPPCMHDSDCTKAGYPVCDTMYSRCVPCTVGDEGACTAVSEICTPQDVCVTCLAPNLNCPTGSMCVDDVCVAPEDIEYASPTAQSGHACTQADPCTLGDAISAVANKVGYEIELVSSSADYSDGPYTIGGTTSVLIAPASSLTSAPTISSKNGPIFTLQSSGKIEIDNVIITGSNDDGVSCKSGTVVLSQDEIAKNGKYGVEATGGTIDVDRSRIHDNNQGGMRFENTTIDVYDNFVYANGNSGTTDGSVDLEGNTNGKLQFNTIAYNNARAGSQHQSAGVGGLKCNNDLGTTLVDARSGIIAGNDGTPYYDNSFGPVVSCLLNPTYVNSSGNGVHFANADTRDDVYDLHLTNQSPKGSIVDVDGACTGDVSVDIDGDMRPSTGCDLGADQY